MENLNNKMKGNYKIYKFGTMPTEQLRILETGNKYGCMNTKASCYKEGMSKEEIRAEFLEHRKWLQKIKITLLTHINFICLVKMVKVSL